MAAPASNTTTEFTADLLDGLTYELTISGTGGVWYEPTVGTGITAGQLNASANRVQVTLTPTADETIRVYRGGTLEVQIEDVTGQSNQNPSEYVSVGVLGSAPYHGLNVDGIKAFTTENGNTVAGNVVTEATGSAITGDIGLLMEPAATNLLVYSEDFSNAAWVKSQIAIDSNVSISPSGASTADRVNVTATTGRHETFDSVTVTGNTQNIASCFVKDDGAGFAAISYYASDGNYHTAVFNLSTGALTDTSTGASASSTSEGIESSDNDWYRIWVSATLSSSTNVFCIICSVDSGTPSYSKGRPSYTAVEGEDLLIWGAQTESGSVPTTYIKTEGATATRNADALSYSGVATDNEVRYVADESYPFTTFVNVDVDDLDLSSGIPLDGMIKSITVYSPGERP